MFGDGTRDILEALADCPNLERIPNQMELKTEKDFEDWISLALCSVTASIHWTQSNSRADHFYRKGDVLGPALGS
ncbi:hypothetical protein BGZ83_006851 [Gryganskiella cystojenkinii]|nr:hypothetical protein BGZ83_006851 [Gryganskiella cystojenkinii]